MFTIAVESNGEFPIVRLVPDRKTAKRSGSFGPLRDHRELLDELLRTAAVRCRLSGHGGTPAGYVQARRLSVQIPVSDLKAMSVALEGVLAGDLSAARAYVSAAQR